MINDKGLLFIEPKNFASREPIIDAFTKKMTAALRKFTEKGSMYRDGTFEPGMATKGWHTCECGAGSHNVDYLLVNGMATNSLCIHYLAFHRDEIPESELEKVKTLPCGEIDPTPEELAQPTEERYASNTFWSKQKQK